MNMQNKRHLDGDESGFSAVKQNQTALANKERDSSQSCHKQTLPQPDHTPPRRFARSLVNPFPSAAAAASSRRACGLRRRRVVVRLEEMEESDSRTMLGALWCVVRGGVPIKTQASLMKTEEIKPTSSPTATERTQTRRIANGLAPRANVAAAALRRAAPGRVRGMMRGILRLLNSFSRESLSGRAKDEAKDEDMEATCGQRERLGAVMLREEGCQLRRDDGRHEWGVAICPSAIPNRHEAANSPAQRGLVRRGAGGGREEPMLTRASPFWNSMWNAFLSTRWSDTALSQFCTDPAHFEPSGAALLLANARSARRLGIHPYTADSETARLGGNISTAGTNISTTSRHRPRDQKILVDRY
ncbi:hypothetical protein DFH08DRAFT_946383 [Mycena albidolilacea]|uniref:Uncharacterized protein n=1 Tax=Mycena albidolilacea TaxID=1033008 RepID=A0AAD6YXA2_9AGAR|nr:hypothetical protein DFH08DRAFT_946383 [Mycena albidolilacea]